MQLVDSTLTACICSTQDLLLVHCALYFVYGLLDFMQLVDSTLTVCMQGTGFITGTLYFLFCVWTLGFYAASG